MYQAHDEDNEADTLQDADFYYKELLLKIEENEEEIAEEGLTTEEGIVLMDYRARLYAEKVKIERFLGIGEEE